MTAIVTCGFTRPALAATRSLGRSKIPVAVATPYRPALAAWSRYTTSTFLVPDPNLDARRFACSISKALHYRYATCALVSTNSALWALSRWRDELPLTAQRVLPPHLSVVRALDFSALYDLAQSVGVDCIDTVRMNPGDNISQICDQVEKFKAPYLIRPLTPWIEREDGTRRIIENRVVDSRKSLESLLNENYELSSGGCIVESRPEGRAIAYVALCKQGRPFAEMCQERIHEARPFSEVATLASTVPMLPKAKKVARTLLEALSWQGPAKVEMIVRPNGEVRLVTVIGRLWGSVQLAINAGIDVPLLCYRLAEDSAQLPKRVIKGKPGVQMRWVRGDLRPLFQNALARCKSLSSPALSLNTMTGRQEIKKRYWDVLDLADPMPFFFELQHATREVIRKDPKRVLKSL